MSPRNLLNTHHVPLLMLRMSAIVLLPIVQHRHNILWLSHLNLIQAQDIVVFAHQKPLRAHRNSEMSIYIPLWRNASETLLKRFLRRLMQRLHLNSTPPRCWRLISCSSPHLSADRHLIAWFAAEPAQHSQHPPQAYSSHNFLIFRFHFLMNGTAGGKPGSPVLQPGRAGSSALPGL